MPSTTTSYIRNKTGILKYQAANRVELNLYHIQLNANWRAANKEHIKEYSKARYQFLKIPFNCEWNRLCNIKV